jgi:hypothetical protein
LGPNGIYGGVQSSIRGLEQAFHQAGCSGFTYTLPVNEVGYPRDPAALSSALDSLHDHEGLDAVLSHNLLGGSLEQCLIASAAAQWAQARRIPHVFATHDVWPTVGELADRFVSVHADCLTTEL